MADEKGGSESVRALIAMAPARGLGAWDAGEDDYNIPPREWLLGVAFCKKYLSSLVADGAVGKSSVRIAQLLALASGRPLTGEHVHKRSVVLLISFEDDRDELRRRIRAAMLHHKIAADEIKGKMYLASPQGIERLYLAEGMPPDEIKVGQLTGLLRLFIKERGVDLVCLDPFIKTHALDENSNTAIDFVCAVLSGLAIDCNIAVDVPHHTRKGTAVVGDADRGRGASAMKDAARLVYTLTPMSAVEAEDFGLEEHERRGLVRLDSAKVNIAPPADKAMWFKLVGVKIGNATEAYPSGDMVGTAERWVPPNKWLNMSAKVANAILDKIDAGLENGSRFTSINRKGSTRGAWMLVREFLPTMTEVQCQDIIDEWLKNGVLVERTYVDPGQRKERLGLEVVPGKRPSGEGEELDAIDM